MPFDVAQLLGARVKQVDEVKLLQIACSDVLVFSQALHAYHILSLQSLTRPI